MALPVTIPNTFANATSSIPLANLDANFVTIYGAVNGIGNGSEALANVSISGGNATFTTANATTVDTTNIEVTNIKAKDGTAAVQIADSTGIVSVTAAPVLTALTASQAVFTNASKALVSNAITGTGNVVLSTSPTLVTPVLGTPSSGTVTNLTGTASININGTVGATTASTGAFTTLNTSGNTTLGDASTDTVTVNGFMGVGATPSSTTALFINSTALTGVSQTGIFCSPTATSSATGTVAGFIANPKTQAAAFTAGNVRSFEARDATKGAGSTITDLHGVFIANQTQGTNNFGITSLVSSGTNKFNIYASGTAANYFAGNVQFAAGTAAAPALTRFGDDNTGMFFPAADTLAASTAGAERMRIDSAGNVGIGTSSPSCRLQIVSTNSVDANNTLTGSWVNVGSSLASGFGMRQRDNSAGISGINFPFQMAVIGGLPFEIYTIDSQPLVFGTATTERMRIDSAGLVGIGTSSPARPLDLASTVDLPQIRITSSGSSVRAQLETTNAHSTWNWGTVGGDTTGDGIIYTNNAVDLRIFTNNTERMRIDSAGTITFNAYGAGTLSTSASGVISASDGRYKTKTREVTSGLEAIAALQPTYFRWNEDSPFASEYEELGFVAQEVAAVIPEASPGEDEEGKYRNYHDRAIIAMLVKGMQEQQALITTLTARVAALESN